MTRKVNNILRYDQVLKEIQLLQTKIMAGINAYDILPTVQNDDLKKIINYCVFNGVSLSKVLTQTTEIINLIKESYREMQILISGTIFSSKILKLLPILGVLLSLIMGINSLNIFFGSLVGLIMFVFGCLFWFIGNKITNSMIEKFNSMLEYSGVYTDTRIQLRIIECALTSGQNLLTAFANSEIEGLKQFASGKPWCVCQISEEYNALYECFLYGSSPIEVIRDLISNASAKMEKHFKEEAEKLSVKMVIPLGLCYLPSFILIGVIPIMMGMLKSI